MEEGLSEFLKFAYEKGKVKEVKDAFEEYPVEKSGIKGRLKIYFLKKVENYVKL